MARNGPLVTLLAGGVLGAGLLVASMAATPEQPAAGEEPVAEATERPDAEPTEEPTGNSDNEADPTATPDPGDSPGQDDATDAPEADDSAEPDADDPDRTQPPDESSDAVTYVGYVDSGAASVAVIVDGGEATAYVCDGNTREAWLSGPATGGVLELSGDQGSLSATFDGFVAEGETTVDGQAWTFSVALVEPPEGLYRFADTIAGGAEVVGGWIVLPDGNQVGAVNVDGETRPAERLDVDTGEVTIDGDVVTAQRQG